MKKYKSKYTIDDYIEEGQYYSFEDLLQIIDEMKCEINRLQEKLNFQKEKDEDRYEEELIKMHYGY